MVKPTPKDNEVLVRVHAAVVTAADCAFRKGEPFIVKLIYGLGKPRLAIQGVEFAGEVEAVGRDVRLFRTGDRVFGMSPDKFGAYAEYICLPEDKPLAVMADGVAYADAVGICDGATTALTFLRDIAKVQPGQKALVNGASGAVGTYAVQLAKHFGAEVTGVCSTANVDLVKSLGADAVIDYTQQDFTHMGRTYDVIFDAVGKSSFSRCKGSLTSRGVYLTTMPTLAILPQMVWTSVGGGKQAKFAAAGLMQNKDNLAFIMDLVAAGTIRAVIDRRYPLDQIAEAHRYVDQGHKKGNVVIAVASNGQ